MKTDGATSGSRLCEQSPLNFVELRLRGNYGLELRAVDEDGKRVNLQYKLVAAPAGFDLSRLRAAWQRWRNYQGIGYEPPQGGTAA